MGLFSSIGKFLGGITGFTGDGLLGFGGNLLGGFLTNSTGKNIAGDQMHFQEYMSSTAHQRQVADLIKAGLNPVLSANSGAAASAGANYVPINAISNATSALRQNALIKSQIDNIAADTASKHAQADYSRSQKMYTDVLRVLASKDVPVAELKNLLLGTAINSGLSILRAPEKSDFRTKQIDRNYGSPK